MHTFPDTMKNIPSAFHAPRHCSRVVRGFTLIELLTVIAIIGILAAIIIPTVGKVRQSAYKAQCGSNLRQLSLAFLMYTEDNKGMLPYSYQGTSDPKRWTLLITGNDNNGNPLGTAYIPGFHGALKDDSPILGCPSARRLGGLRDTAPTYSTNRKIINNNDSRKNISEVEVPSKTMILADGKDGFSTVDMDGTTTANCPGYLDPHDGTVNLGFADGHVESRSRSNFPLSTTSSAVDYVGHILWWGK
ncbi:hypothetical protein OPIT5_17425 [Opitutaceae bacterium TAV5]|nr:hypothetical protein OPIT5_17425 [Opitutaceae bacterium TAV5]